ncbi:MAG: hypothetical protein MJY74_04590 [Bacteroidaceae bacterium]|nr:hypothetical protein [Bacteroidaceae bacterium]
MENIRFEIHPHNGYLNTDFIISNDSQESVMILDEHLGIIHPLVNLRAGEKVQKKLAAGKHKLFTEGRSIHEELVTVQDAIKLGGGRGTGAYTSTISPWVLIKMTDRMYFHNNETGAEYVEINLVPDEVQYLSKDYLLFHSKRSGYSVYSIPASCIIMSSDEQPVFCNDVCSILKSSTNEVAFFNIICYDGRLLKFNVEDCKINSEAEELYCIGINKIQIFSLATLSQVGEIMSSLPVVTVIDQGFYIGRNPKYVSSPFSIFDLHCGKNEKVGEIPIFGDLIKIGCAELIPKEEFEQANEVYNNLCNSISASSRSLLSFHFKEVTQFNCIKGELFYRINECELTGNGIRETSSYICKANSGDKIAIDKSSTVHEFGSMLCVDNYSKKKFISSEGTLLDFGETTLIKAGREIVMETSFSDGSNKIVSENGAILFSGAYESTVKLMGSYQDSNILAEYGFISIKGVSGHYTLLNLFDNSIKCSDIISYYKCGGRLLMQDASRIIYALTREGKIKELPKELNNYNIVLSISDDADCIIAGQKDRFGNVLAIDEYLWDKTDGAYSQKSILNKIFDASIYKNVLFSGDGKHIVYSDSEGAFSCMDLNDGSVQCFDNEKFVQHFNGYRSEIVFAGNSSAKPRVIDPITGQYLDALELSEYKFCSPNGDLFMEKPELDKCAVDGVGNIDYHDLRTNSGVSVKEYNEITSAYNIPPIKESDEDMISKRISFMKAYPSLFTSAVNKKIAGVKRWKDITVSESDIRCYTVPCEAPQSRKEINEAILYFVRFTDDFSQYVIKRTEYLVVKNRLSGHSTRITIGTPLWFLNYVSFSFDSKYIAIAGRYPDNTFDPQSGQSIGGLFLLFDINNNSIIVTSTDTNAVWVSAFTKKGLIAYYDSTPRTFLRNVKDLDPIEIRGRNFLTFSPSGKYFALSEQGYIRSGNSQNRQWGHQPSTSVYLRSADDPGKEICSYNDHGSGIANTGTRTVSMVAFSHDDKHLLSVSDDGVVVIRNLHLC